VSQLAIVLFECGDVTASIPHFEKALTLDGAVFAGVRAAAVHLPLARVPGAGRVEDALRRAQQGALLPPESAEAHFHLGRAYVARNAPATPRPRAARSSARSSSIPASTRRARR
jgi:tetratricopeptide (TPR) repeat protein